MEVHDVQDILKCVIFDINLYAITNSKRSWGVQPYINYKEKRIVEEALKRKQSGKRGDEKRRSDNDNTKNQRSRFTDYTPQNPSRETILRECLNTEFKEVGIKAPQLLRQTKITDRTKYCLYDQIRDHDT